jgi:hypothetical protein
MESARKARLIRQIWLTAISLSVVAIAIFVLSLNFAQTNSNAGASCAPTATPVTGAQGLTGLSAYDLWISSGNTGTKDEFLKSLVGERGPRGYTGSNGVSNEIGYTPSPGASGAPGADGTPGEAGEPGPSAYQLWLDAGNVGTPEEFLVSLVGTAGVDGAAGSDGVNGLDGLSAYELWLSNGNYGDLSVFLSSLVGAPGAPGQDGTDGSDGEDGPDGAAGLSAFEIWKSNGNVGTEQDFIDSLKGAPGICTAGDQGDSAYEVWLAQGNTGTEQDFLDSLRGASGSGGLPYNGSFYDTTTQTNASSTNLMRYNTTDPWTVGVRVNSTFKSRIYLDHPGIYNVQFSTQFAKTDSGTDFINIWLRKNGSDVPMTNTQLRSWGNDDRQVAAWNFFVEASAGDYYEIAWRSNDKNISMLSTPANGYPGIPSVILTVTQVR